MTIFFFPRSVKRRNYKEEEGNYDCGSRLFMAVWGRSKKGCGIYLSVVPTGVNSAVNFLFHCHRRCSVDNPVIVLFI